MNSSPEQYQWIEQYLKGELSGSEKSAFEKRMEDDPSFSEEVEMQKMLNDLIFEKGLADIRKKVGEDMPPPGSTINKTLLYSLIGILLAGGSISFYWIYRKEQQVVLLKDTQVKEKVVVSEDKPSVLTPEPSAASKEDKKEIPSVADYDEKVTEKKDNLVSDSATKIFNNTEKVDENTPTIEEVSVLRNDTTRSIEKAVDQLPQIVEQKETKDIPCPGIKFEFRTDMSCKNQSTGSIEILQAGIKGGKAPYLYAINGHDFSSQRIFTELPAGSHKVILKDDNECVSEKEIQISEKACVEFKDYSFNPATERWNFPLMDNESGTITITTNFGKPVYKTEIINGIPETWDGRSESGEALETGTYIYIAQTREGEIRQGYIIILH